MIKPFFIKIQIVDRRFIGATYCMITLIVYAIIYKKYTCNTVHMIEMKFPKNNRRRRGYPKICNKY